MKMQAMEIYQLACSFPQQLNLSKQELQNILMDYTPHLYIPLIMDMEVAKGLELYLQQNSSVNINILNVVKEWILLKTIDWNKMNLELIKEHRSGF